MNNITPKTVEKKICDLIRSGATYENAKAKKAKRGRGSAADNGPVLDKAAEIDRLTAEMKKAASELRFEEAAYLRDKIKELQMVK